MFNQHTRKINGLKNKIILGLFAAVLALQPHVAAAEELVPVFGESTSYGLDIPVGDKKYILGTTNVKGELGAEVATRRKKPARSYYFDYKFPTKEQRDAFVEEMKEKRGTATEGPEMTANEITEIAKKHGGGRG